MKTFRLCVFAFLFSVFPLTGQNYYAYDVFRNSMYESDDWTVNINGYTPYKNFNVKDNTWLGISLQHFPVEPNMYGNNLISIDGHINISPDFKTLQVSTGWVGALGASAIYAGNSRRFEKCYREYIDYGYNSKEAERECREINEPTESEKMAMIGGFLLGLESASLHFPFGRYFGMSIDWSLVKLNYHFKEKEVFLTANAGGGLEALIANHLLLRVSANYTFTYKPWKNSPYVNEGLFFGASLGYRW